MDKWRLIISEPLKGAMNMAIDEAIMLAVSAGLAPPTIRFYQWSPAAITLGYFQSLQKEIDLNACQDAGVDVVRRLTGGRAVLHHRELTYSLVAPGNNCQVAGSVLQSYLAISRGLVAGLAGLGIQAEITEGKKRSSHNASAACFDTPSWYELAVGGKKVVGSAQTRRGGCLLQHGSVIVEMHTDLLFDLLNFNDENIKERAKRYFSAQATSINEILGYTTNFAELYQCLQKGFAAALNITLEQAQLTSKEILRAEELCHTKYDTIEWNGLK